MMLDNDMKYSALKVRNNAWAKSKAIPSWVNINTVDLDQFFTRPVIAKKCHESLLEHMMQDGIDVSKIKFIEPSVGGGAFFDLLPLDQRVGIG